MNVIKELIKECTREDCCIVVGASMYFPTTYDKHGNITSKDYNTRTTDYSCKSCGINWMKAECAGKQKYHKKHQMEHIL